MSKKKIQFMLDEYGFLADDNIEARCDYLTFKYTHNLEDFQVFIEEQFKKSYVENVVLHFQNRIQGEKDLDCSKNTSIIKLKGEKVDKEKQIIYCYRKAKTSKSEESFFVHIRGAYANSILYYMEADTTFLRPKSPGKFEVSRLDYKIMYPIETDDLVTTLGEFYIKQSLHELTKKPVRLTTTMASDDGVTVAVGNRRSALYTRVYSFYNEPEEETHITQSNKLPLSDESPKIEKQHMLNIEVEIKKNKLDGINLAINCNNFYMMHHSILNCFIKEYLTLVKCKIFSKARTFDNFVNTKMSPYDLKYLGIIQRTDPELQTSEQISEYSKVKIKDLLDTGVMPLSPLIMNFVHKKESDFTVSLLILLSEFYHCSLRRKTTPNQFLKIVKQFSQMDNLSLSDPDKNEEKQTDKSTIKELEFKAVHVTISDDFIFKMLLLEPSYYNSQRIQKFFEMLINTKIKVYQNVGKKKVLKTSQICYDHYHEKIDDVNTYNIVTLHPYFLCQAFPFNFYFRPSLHSTYYGACMAFNKGHEMYPMPSKLLLNFVATITLGKDFSIRNHEYPMTRIKEKEHFSWLLIICLETVLNSMFFKEVSLIDTKDTLFKETNVFEIQRLIVKSKKNSTLAIRAIPTPRGYIPHIKEQFINSLVSKCMYQ